MKKGEVCMLTCKPEYAYGKSGSPPKIPGDTTLLFEISMISWQKEDLSKNKDGGILRTILVSGDGYTTPNEGSLCEGQDELGFRWNMLFSKLLICQIFCKILSTY